MDFVSIKIETDDVNQNVVEHENQEIGDTNTDDISLEIKIEEETNSFTSVQDYSNTKPDSSFDVKIEIDDMIEPTDLFAEETSDLFYEDQGLMDIANLDRK